MGAFYNSICIPGDRDQEVRDSLQRWLGGRGFELSDQPVLFDLDGETERCAFLIWNERWTVLVFSKYEEERRLIRELQTWGGPLLYLWVQDSDVWGYDLFGEAGFVASFNSDPRSYVSFPGEDAAPRPAADAREVCRRLGFEGRAAELLRIHRHRAAFKEDSCLEMCRLIDAEPALASYDDLERGAFEDLEGWRVEQLHFVHRDARGGCKAEVGLHDVRLDAEAMSSGIRLERFEIPAEVLTEMERRRRRVRLRLTLLKPVSWLARAWRKAREAPARARRERRVEGASPSLPDAGFSRHESSDIIEVRHLINERHRCRIRLAVGGEAKSGSTKPASVFAFQIGETPITCTARPRARITEVLQQPSRSKILRDEKYLIGGLQARHVVYELPPYYLAGTSGPSYLGLHVVQTEVALYVFLYRFPRKILKEVERAILATVRSFRLLT
ncbi:MAG: hypothetical protein GY719_33740 [bacterium]|nr:hypothetical protein [bacterium]